MENIQKYVIHNISCIHKLFTPTELQVPQDFSM